MSNPTERESFEAWASHEYPDYFMDKDSVGDYYAEPISVSWKSWQARAQQAAAPGALHITPQEAAAAGIECGDTACGGCNAGEPWCIHSAPGTPEAPADRHPVQPLIEDEHGRARFKENAIVRHLSEGRLNELAVLGFPEADWEQFAQLIGYSLDGFGTLSYVTDETYDRAAEQPVLTRAAQLDGGQEGSEA